MFKNTFTMTLHKQHKILAHLITEKAKQNGKMRKFDYEHIVKPFATILREAPISERELLVGLNRAKVLIVK